MTCKGSCTNSFSILFKIDTNYLELLYGDLPENTLAQKLKKFKLLRGLTQHQLATLTGVSRAMINEIEAGYRKNVSSDILTKLFFYIWCTYFYIQNTIYVKINISYIL